MPAECFKGHVATDGSLLGKRWQVVSMWLRSSTVKLRGRDGAFAWVYGSMEEELEVQRTIKRAELTAFLCLLRKGRGPIEIHVDYKGIIDGIRRPEKECIKPRAGDADL